MTTDRFVHLINRTHLIYLGLLPSLATFALVSTYGHPAPLLLLVGGVIVTGVYLAASFSYTVLPSSVIGSLWALLDGPLFALTARGWEGTPWSFFVEGFLIDALALWTAILGLTLVSSAPSPGQRAASFGLALVAIGALLSLFVPYGRDALLGHWSRLGWILAGVVETTVVLYQMLNTGQPVRMDVDAAGIYIAVMVVIWVGAMCAGAAIYGAR